MDVSGWITQCIVLMLTPFLHEDVAIVMAAIFIAQDGLSWRKAFISLYAGAVLSDLTIYGLGAAARRVPGIRKLLISDRVERARNRLNDNLVKSVAVCRIVPGVLFPTFVACGWVGVPFWRFAGVTVTAAGVYTAVMLFLVTTFGHAVLRYLGLWSWVALLAAIAGFGIYGMWRPAWGLLGTLLTPRLRRGAPAGEENAPSGTHRGLPSLNHLWRTVAVPERLPQNVFYFPVGVRWFVLGILRRGLTLPTVANPCIEMGGLWGESKSRYLEQVSSQQRQWLAPFAVLKRGQGAESDDGDLERALRAIETHGLAFPVVVKPDVGWQGYGVRVVSDAAELREYISQFPENESMLLQHLVGHDGEAGIYYERMPGEAAGRISSVCLRYFPHVVGDGKSTVRDIIARDHRAHFKARFHTGKDPLHGGVPAETLDSVPGAGEVVRLSFIGSIRVGGLYRDGRRFITEAMRERFHAVAAGMPEFFVGRFDVRFKSIERLQAGEDFLIIEINGAGSEPIHVWDPETTLWNAYRGLFRYQSLIFEIGARNRERGYKPVTLRKFFEFTLRQERLLSRYPPSH